MDLLDLILLLLCVAFAVSGYRQGFLVGFLSFVGLIGGALLGASYAPGLHHLLGFHGNGTVFGLISVVLIAGIGLILGTFAGALLRNRLTWTPARQLDSVGGAAVGIISVLLVSWLIGTAATATPFRVINSEVSNSKVLSVVDDLVPSGLRTIAPAFRRLLNDSGFPQVFSSLGPHQVVPVSPPDAKLARSAIVRQARPSVVKVTGVASGCSRQLEGSGFVFADGRVMTDAHVVAGVDAPTVRTAGGASYPARVVLYDPNRDVAVLAVPALSASPLRFAGPLTRGDSAIVLGYPENGPFTAGAARIRDTQEATGPNIYQDREVTRQIYAVEATVRPGNSGGPLLTPKGTVGGVVFAASTDNAATGYALTASEVAGDARAGATASRSVSTQGCD